MYVYMYIQYKTSDPSEMSMQFFQTIPYNIPEENNLHASEMLKTYNITIFHLTNRL